MLHRLWKLCNRLGCYKVSNALAHYNASQFKWKMIPVLTPPSLTDNRFESLVNGYKSIHYLGWIKEIDPGFIDSDPELKGWDIAFPMQHDTTGIIVRCR